MRIYSRKSNRYCVRKKDCFLLRRTRVASGVTSSTNRIPFVMDDYIDILTDQYADEVRSISGTKRKPSEDFVKESEPGFVKEYPAHFPSISDDSSQRTSRSESPSTAKETKWHPYHCFAAEQQEKMRLRNPNILHKDLKNLIEDQWKACSNEEKEVSF